MSYRTARMEVTKYEGKRMEDQLLFRPEKKLGKTKVTDSKKKRGREKKDIFTAFNAYEKARRSKKASREEGGDAFRRRADLDTGPTGRNIGKADVHPRKAKRRGRKVWSN